ncbi:hypothetical protein EII18_02945 [Comamonadaceae bacterium OH3737_COT-264]|nr:hypothetical protein EII18_02945 [Comamonadaceae bacterium OH3737_COT-264]
MQHSAGAPAAQARCPKCHAPRQDFAPHASCPQCGIIYDKYDPVKAAELEARRQALRNGKKPAPAQRKKAAGFADSAPPSWMESWSERPRYTVQPAAFIKHLRQASIYPTFRQLVGLFYFLQLLLGMVFLFVGFYVFFYGPDSAIRASGLLGGVFMGLLLVIVAKVFREMSLMMADLSDAAVTIAASMQPEQ